MSNFLLVNKVLCTIFGHHYALSKNIMSNIKEYDCLHCGKQVTTDANGKLRLLTNDRKQINQALASFHGSENLPHEPNILEVIHRSDASKTAAV